MSTYWQLLQVLAPLFALIAIGVGMRRAEWLTAAADESMLKVLIRFFYPCLILDNVLGNQALQVPGNLLIPPVIGFATIALGIAGALWAGRRLGMEPSGGLRTFAFTTGIYNYGYIPIPLMAALYGPTSLGVLLVHNVGCEVAIWTVGVFVLAGLPLREGWRRLFNPPVCSLLAALALNLLGGTPHLPTFVLTVIHLCAQCAIPLGLLLIGATLENLLLRKTASLFDFKVTVAACVLRLGLYPLAFLFLAWILPVSIDLKRVMVVQAGMPAGIFSVVIAKHYGGREEVSAQVALATGLLGLVVIPLWLQLGLRLVSIT
jgi:malate permease and related proteins